MNTQPENRTPEADWQPDKAKSAANERPTDDSEQAGSSPVETSSDATLEDLQVQLAEAEKRVLMAQADLENFRRRTRQNAQEQIKYASLALMNEIVESVDNLKRAVEAHQNDPDGTGLAEGVKLVAQQISNALANHGCNKIEAEGQPFDPTFHQAVTMQASDTLPPNTVLQELRPGFLLHDRVIRPSQVIVSK